MPTPTTKSTTYAWTETMRNISRDPKLEQMTRDAAIAACMFCDELGPDDVLPRFDGDSFLRPTSATATKMAAFCMAGVKTGNAVESSTVLTTAVMIANVFLAGGKGAAGWTAVQDYFSPPKAKATP